MGAQNDMPEAGCEEGNIQCTMGEEIDWQSSEFALMGTDG